MQLVENIDGIIRVYECKAKKEELQRTRRELLTKYYENHRKFIRIETTNERLKEKIVNGQNEWIGQYSNVYESPLEDYLGIHGLEQSTKVEEMLQQKIIEQYINGEESSKKISRIYEVIGNFYEKLYYGNIMKVSDLEAYELQNRKVYVFPRLLKLPDSLCALQYFEQGDLKYLSEQEDELYKDIPVSIYKDSLKQIGEFSGTFLNYQIADNIREEVRMSTLILNRIKEAK